MLLLLACTSPTSRPFDLTGTKGTTGDGDTAPDIAGDTDPTGEDSDPPDDTGADDTAITGVDSGSGLPTGQMVIGFWCGPPAAALTATRMAEIAAAGITTVSNACDTTTYTPEYNLEMLRLAAAEGMDAVVTDSRGLSAAAGVDIDANVSAMVADYASAPNLRAYHVYDEPGTGVFSTLASVVDTVAAHDPAHYTSINLLPDYASTAQLGADSYSAYVGSFLGTVAPGFFTYDHYNFLSDGTDGPTFFSNLAVVRDNALAAGAPWGQYIQAISYSGHRATTGAEKRWAAMHTLAYGGTGVYYFTWWTPDQTAEGFGDGIIGASGAATSQYADVTDINRSLRAIGPFLAAATSTSVFHNGTLAASTSPRQAGDPVYIPSATDLTVGLFSAADGMYALVVNRDHTAAVSADVVLSTPPEVLDVGSGTFTAATGTSADALGIHLPVTLAAGDAVLLHLPGPVPDGPTGAEAYFGSVRADSGALDVVDSRFGTSRLRSAGWDDCPAGTSLIGRDFESNGFWLCAPAATAGSTFYVGNVVADSGYMYQVSGGTTTYIGTGGWGYCPAGTLLGQRFESNGYWVCMT